MKLRLLAAVFAALALGVAAEEKTIVVTQCINNDLTNTEFDGMHPPLGKEQCYLGNYKC